MGNLKTWSGNTVLPERSILREQKSVKNAKIEKSKSFKKTKKKIRIKAMCTKVINAVIWRIWRIFQILLFIIGTLISLLEPPKNKKSLQPPVVA